MMAILLVFIVILTVLLDEAFIRLKAKRAC